MCGMCPAPSSRWRDAPATAADVHGGDYFGPDGRGEMRGHHPKRVQFCAAAHDQAAAARLWAVSEELTGVTFEALTAR